MICKACGVDAFCFINTISYCEQCYKNLKLKEKREKTREINQRYKNRKKYTPGHAKHLVVIRLKKNNTKRI